MRKNTTLSLGSASYRRTRASLVIIRERQGAPNSPQEAGSWQNVLQVMFRRTSSGNWAKTRLRSTAGMKDTDRVLMLVISTQGSLGTRLHVSASEMQKGEKSVKSLLEFTSFLTQNPHTFGLVFPCKRWKYLGKDLWLGLISCVLQACPIHYFCEAFLSCCSPPPGINLPFLSHLMTQYLFPTVLTRQTLNCNSLRPCLPFPGRTPQNSLELPIPTVPGILGSRHILLTVHIES